MFICFLISLLIVGSVSWWLGLFALVCGMIWGERCFWYLSFIVMCLYWWLRVTCLGLMFVTLDLVWELLFCCVDCLFGYDCIGITIWVVWCFIVCIWVDSYLWLLRDCVALKLHDCWLCLDFLLVSVAYGCCLVSWVACLFMLLFSLMFVWRYWFDCYFLLFVYLVFI